MNDLLYIDRTTCVGCAVCVDICPTGAIRLDENEGVAVIDQALCTGCLACLDECPTGAIQRAELPELVPVSAAVEGEVIEGEVMPAPATRFLAPVRQPGRLAVLASTAMTFVGRWLLPRAANALVGAVERRLARGTNPVSPVTSLRSANRPQMRQTGRGRGGRGRQRRQRRRGK